MGMASGAGYLANVKSADVGAIEGMLKRDCGAYAGWRATTSFAVVSRFAILVPVCVYL